MLEQLAVAHSITTQLDTRVAPATTLAVSVVPQASLLLDAEKVDPA